MSKKNKFSLLFVIVVLCWLLGSIHGFYIHFYSTMCIFAPPTLYSLLIDVVLGFSLLIILISVVIWPNRDFSRVLYYISWCFILSFLGELTSNLENFEIIFYGIMFHGGAIMMGIIILAYTYKILNFKRSRADINKSIIISVVTVLLSGYLSSFFNPYSAALIENYSYQDINSQYMLEGKSFIDEENNLLFRNTSYDSFGFSVYSLQNDSLLLSIHGIDCDPIAFYKLRNDRYFIKCKEGEDSIVSIWEIELELRRIMVVDLMEKDLLILDSINYDEYMLQKENLVLEKLNDN